MKAIIYVLVFLLASCTYSHEKDIEKVEAFLASGKTDSASLAIEEIHRPEDLPRPLLSRYALALGRLHEERGEALSEDSLLRDAYDYYTTAEPQDTAKIKQVTLLLAKYYWWNGARHEAYDLLRGALDKYENSVVLLAGLFEMYGDDGDFEHARQSLARIIELDKNNSGLLYQNMYNYGTLSFYVKDTTGFLRVFHDLETYLRTPQDTAHFMCYGLRTYADVMSDYGDQQRAISLQRRSLDYYMGKDSTEVSYSYASLARYYLLLGNLTEATRCLRQSDAYETAVIREDLSYAGYVQVLRILLDYAEQGRVDFKEWASFVNNLQDNAQRRRKVIEAKEQKARQLNERNLNLVISRQQTQITATYVVIALIVVIAGLLYYNRRRVKRIADQEEEIELLRKMITETRQQPDAKDDRFFKKVLLRQLGVIKMAASQPTAANQELLKRMTEITSKAIEVDSLLDWEVLYQTLDYVYDGYYSHLKGRYGDLLNEKEMQLCCLLRANFSTKEISIVTQQGIRTVYQRKTVIRQKLEMGEKGDIVEFTQSS